jgi:hypothetical protein
MSKYLPGWTVGKHKNSQKVITLAKMWGQTCNMQFENEKNLDTEITEGITWE